MTIVLFFWFSLRNPLSLCCGTQRWVPCFCSLQPYHLLAYIKYWFSSWTNSYCVFIKTNVRCLCKSRLLGIKKTRDCASTCGHSLIRCLWIDPFSNQIIQLPKDANSVSENGKHWCLWLVCACATFLYQFQKYVITDITGIYRIIKRPVPMKRRSYYVT